MTTGLQRAYLLNRRDYRETSLLLDLLTEDEGRQDVVARGARTRRGTLLQPFQPLLVTLRGRQELKTLTSVENSGRPRRLSGDALYSGFYLNELLCRALHRQDHTQGLFEAYETALSSLENAAPGRIEPALRRFEFELLELLGYGLDLEHAVDTGRPVTQQRVYVVPLEGIYEARPEAGYLECGLATLEAVAERDFSSGAVQREAKTLARASIHALIGGRPLKSRELFRSGGA